MALYKQFLTSSLLTNFIDQLQLLLSNKTDIETFISDYMNLETAKGFGLDVIGAKIGINRIIVSTIFDDKEKIGFKGQELGNFYKSNFAKLSKTGNYYLQDEQYRRVLKMGYMAISTPCTIPGVNKFYKAFYPNTTIIENLMEIIVNIIDPIDFVETLILTRRDLLPIPMGVNIEYNFPNGG